MSDVRMAAGLERLPWLSDEPNARAPLRRRRRRRWPLWLAAALAALIAVASAAYWAGTRSGPDAEPAYDAPSIGRPPVTIPLPAPVAAPTPVQPQVEIPPLPQVKPVAVPSEPAARPAAAPRRAAVRAPARVRPPPPPPPAARAKPAKRAAPPAKSKSTALPLWPVRAESNASGRLVRVGTFATPRQAKRGWTRIMRLYPGMTRLPALVVPIRAVPSGRQYYRLQMGTTSQAHSEVLCQRMRIIGVSCVVLDIGTTRR